MTPADKIITALGVAGFVGGTIATLAGAPPPILALWCAAFLSVQVAGAVQRARLARRRSRGHAAAELAAAVDDLRAGDCVVEGKVAYAEGADVAMRVDFEQVGSESESSGSWSHEWKEISRKLTVHPFYLVRANGTRIRVEPGQDSQLYDTLESKVLVSTRPGNPHRIRFATLVPGEIIWVTGRLERGFDPEHTGGAAQYRSLPESWMFRGTPTLLVSSVSLAAHFAARARLHRWHALVYAVLLTAPVLLTALYWDRVRGETVDAVVVDNSEAHDDDGKVTGYTPIVRHVHGTSEGETRNAALDPDTHLAFRVGQHSANEGADAHLTNGERWLSFLFAVGLLIVRGYLGYRSAALLPWYRSAKARVNDGGPGRLA